MPKKPVKPRGKKQGYNARLDESLGERRGKQSTKKVSAKGRRAQARGARRGKNK